MGKLNFFKYLALFEDEPFWFGWKLKNDVEYLKRFSVAKMLFDGINDKWKVSRAKKVMGV